MLLLFLGWFVDQYTCQPLSCTSSERDLCQGALSCPSTFPARKESPLVLDLFSQGVRPKRLLDIPSLHTPIFPAVWQINWCHVGSGAQSQLHETACLSCGQWCHDQCFHWQNWISPRVFLLCHVAYEVYPTIGRIVMLIGEANWPVCTWKVNGINCLESTTRVCPGRCWTWHFSLSLDTRMHVRGCFNFWRMNCM